MYFSGVITGAKAVNAGSGPRSEGVATARGESVCGGGATIPNRVIAAVMQLGLKTGRSPSWVLAVVLIAVACSSSSGETATPMCDYIPNPSGSGMTKRPCPDGKVCGFVDGYTEICLSSFCAALSECCGRLGGWDSTPPAGLTNADCIAALQAQSSTQCAGKLHELEAANYCLQEDLGDGLGPQRCEGEGATCTGDSGPLNSGSCCAGFACEQRPAEGGGYHCGVCVPQGQHCSPSTTNACCDGSFCDYWSSGKCVPLLKNGDACGSFDYCESGVCTNDVCVDYGSGGSGAGGSGGSTSTCDPNTCNGSQSECTEYGCVTCWEACNAGSCESTCSDTF